MYPCAALRCRPLVAISLLQVFPAHLCFTSNVPTYPGTQCMQLCNTAYAQP